MEQDPLPTLRTVACAALWLCGCYATHPEEQPEAVVPADADPIVTPDAGPGVMDAATLPPLAQPDAALRPPARPDGGPRDAAPRDATTMPPPSPPDAKLSWALVYEAGQTVRAMALNRTGHALIELTGSIVGGEGHEVATSTTFEIDALGAVLWTTRATGVWVEDLTVGPQDTVAIAGRAQGNSQLPGGEPSGVVHSEVFVAKLGTHGDVAWSQRFGDDPNPLGADQHASAVAVDADGNVIIAGAFEGALDLRGKSLNAVGGRDAFVAKLDPAGQLLWGHGFGGAGEQHVRDVAVDAAGNVLLTGAYEGSVDFGGGPLTPADGGVGWHQFIAKLSPAGAHVWSRGYGAESGFIVDVAGDGSLTLVQAWRNQIGNEYFLAQFDAQGEPRASRGLGLFEPQAASAMRGSYTLAGATKLPGLEQPSLGIERSSRPELAQFGPSLATERELQFGPGVGHVVRAAVVDAAGGLYVAGEFRDQISIGSGVTLGGDGLQAFIARFAPGWP